MSWEEIRSSQNYGPKLGQKWNFSELDFSFINRCAFPWAMFPSHFWLVLISSQLILIRHIILWIKFHKIPNFIFNLAPTRVFSSNLQARWLEWRLKIILMETQTSSIDAPSLGRRFQVIFSRFDVIRSSELRGDKIGQHPFGCTSFSIERFEFGRDNSVELSMVGRW